MASATSLSLSLSLDTFLRHHHHLSFSPSSPLHLSSKPFPSSSPVSKSLPLLSLHIPKSLPPSPSPSPFPISPPQPAPFLGPSDLDKLALLESFRHKHDFDHGSLEVRLMDDAEVDTTVELLAESFADAMWMPKNYVRFLGFLVKQYVLEKREVLPHAATLVGFYKGSGEEEARLAATAEISFDVLGANASPPTPVPPRECPYICNMTVNKELRRKGIGWHLLKACEELISMMSEQQTIYLHCRVVDKGPFSMYRKAGYKVYKTDNILVWLTLQRRKHLMCKEILMENSSELDNHLEG